MDFFIELQRLSFDLWKYCFLKFLTCMNHHMFSVRWAIHIVLVYIEVWIEMLFYLLFPKASVATVYSIFLFLIFFFLESKNLRKSSVFERLGDTGVNSGSTKVTLTGSGNVIVRSTGSSKVSINIHMPTARLISVPKNWETGVKPKNPLRETIKNSQINLLIIW